MLIHILSVSSNYIVCMLKDENDNVDLAIMNKKRLEKKRCCEDSCSR